ncbi:hypothetical protein MPER_00614, partial [Moniliophthora perniciosa FA553]
KQDQAEAKNSVDTRLEFIQAQLKDIEGRSEKKKQELVEIQTALQQQQTHVPERREPSIIGVI